MLCDNRYETVTLLIHKAQPILLNSQQEFNVALGLPKLVCKNI
jgi:hypothetical protein